MGGPTRRRALVASWFILAQIVAVSAQLPAEITATYLSTVTGTAPSSSSTASSGPQVIEVTVNKGSTNRFDPEEITANVGDVISFQFYPTNHSVVKAEYGYPCVPYNYVEPGAKDMFFSGNRLMQATDPVEIWNLTVNSTAPTFFYCSAIDSCIKDGMLGVINPNSTMTLEHQRDLALEPNTIQLSPGDPIPAEASATMMHSTPTSAPTSTSSAAAPTPTSTNTANNHTGGLSGGAIAGIAVAGVAAVLICGLLFFYIGRTKSLKDVLNRNSATVPMTQGPHDPSFPGYGYMPQQQNDHRQSRQPYGGPYTPSEAPGSPAFNEAEFASARVQQDGPAELASTEVPEKRRDLSKNDTLFFH